MTLAPWYPILTNILHENRRHSHSRFFQLATVSADGYPRNRTVVFRGFLEETNLLQIITDTRSEKMIDLRVNPRAEIAWYFTETREQVRIKGKIAIISHEENNPQLQQIRLQLWGSISDMARLQFTWDYPKKSRLLNVPFPKIYPPLDSPVEFFSVLLFNPHEVDHLMLRGNPQNRYLYRLLSDGNWSKEEVNP